MNKWIIRAVACLIWMGMFGYMDHLGLHGKQQLVIVVLAGLAAVANSLL